MTESSEELVVIVDASNTALGTAKKSEVHGVDTPMHRAFSSFLFRADGQFLITQRSRHKKTWPLVWTNSCCGHPAPGESFIDAVSRRVRFELGVTPHHVTMIIPDYTYKYSRDGVMEHEFCPVLVGLLTRDLRLNSAEIDSHEWVSWHEWCERVEHDDLLSEWCRDETRLLQTSKAFAQWLVTYTHPGRKS